MKDNNKIKEVSSIAQISSKCLQGIILEYFKTDPEQCYGMGMIAKINIKGGKLRNNLLTLDVMSSERILKNPAV